VPRFFCKSSDIAGDKIIMRDKEQVHHIRDVLRLKIKDKVTLCDESGNGFDCAIEQISGKIILAIKTRRAPSMAKQKVKITIACAIPKKCKFDDIVDKLTQLGVNKIIPLLTERVIVNWDARKKSLQQKRWEKIALNASQQSQRSVLPVIEPVRRIEEVLANSGDFDLKLIPALIGERKPLKEILTQAHPGNILFLIGPEGDFTPEEVGKVKSRGFIPVTLGAQVLRVDTAAIAVASYIKLTYS